MNLPRGYFLCVYEGQRTLHKSLTDSGRTNIASPPGRMPRTLQNHTAGVNKSASSCSRENSLIFERKEKFSVVPPIQIFSPITRCILLFKLHI